MSYQTRLSRKAQKSIHSCSPELTVRITAKIDFLAENPHPPGSLKLKGEENRYRIRVGSWRILYSIDDSVKVVTVHLILPRDEVYRTDN